MLSNDLRLGYELYDPDIFDLDFVRISQKEDNLFFMNSCRFWLLPSVDLMVLLLIRYINCFLLSKINSSDGNMKVDSGTPSGLGFNLPTDGSK
jgi:hypothetical protein